MADRPDLSTKEFEKKAAETQNPRHRRMWETIVEHTKAEIARDIEGTMRTVAPDPDYTLRSSAMKRPKGWQEVTAFYRQMFASGGLDNMAIRDDACRRLIACDEAVVIEMVMTSHLPGRLARDRGYSIPDLHAHYARHSHLVVLVPFDPKGRMLGEIPYGQIVPSDWDRIPDDKLSPGYLNWVRRYATSA